MSATMVIATPPRQQRNLWRSWTFATAVGEVFGFAVPALTGALLLWQLGEPDTAGSALAFYLLLVVAGIGEGSVLGSAQWRVLRQFLPAVSRPAWVGATAAAGGFAWALGLLPSTLDALRPLPSWLLLAMWAALATPLLLSIGLGQWFVLRRHLAGAGFWVPANALGWLLGLPLTFIGPALVPNDSPAPVWIAAFLAGGLLMGAVVGAVTGRALSTLVARAESGAHQQIDRSVPV